MPCFRDAVVIIVRNISRLSHVVIFLKLTENLAGPSGRAFWGEVLDRLNAEIVGSNPA
jgi:hypothetical protein